MFSNDLQIIVIEFNRIHVPIDSIESAGAMFIDYVYGKQMNGSSFNSNLCCLKGISYALVSRRSVYNLLSFFNLTPPG